MLKLSRWSCYMTQLLVKCAIEKKILRNPDCSLTKNSSIRVNIIHWPFFQALTVSIKFDLNFLTANGAMHQSQSLSKSNFVWKQWRLHSPSLSKSSHFSRMFPFCKSKIGDGPGVVFSSTYLRNEIRSMSISATAPKQVVKLAPFANMSIKPAYRQLSAAQPTRQQSHQSIGFARSMPTRSSLLDNGDSRDGQCLESGTGRDNILSSCWLQSYSWRFLPCQA